MKWAPLALWVVLFVPVAGAEVEGDCTVTLQGVDVAGHRADEPAAAIPWREGEALEYNMSLNGTAASWRITAFLGPIERVLVQQDAAGPLGLRAVLGNITGASFPAASGLYQVRGEATTTDGATCSAKALVLVHPPAGWTPLLAGAVVVGGAAAGGIVVSAVGGFQDTKEAVDVTKDFVTELRKAKSGVAALKK